jgi:hypothetical protein
MFHLGIEPLHPPVLYWSRWETARAAQPCWCNSGEVSCFAFARACQQRCCAPRQKQTRFLTQLTEPGRIQNIHAGSYCSFADGQPAAPASAQHRSIEMDRIRRIHASTRCSFVGERLVGPMSAQHRSIERSRIRAYPCRQAL